MSWSLRSGPLMLARAGALDTVEDVNLAELFARPIEEVHEGRPLEPAKFSIFDDDAILSMCWSDAQSTVYGSGALLATVSTAGHAKVWQVSGERTRAQWRLLRILRDTAERGIDEFFTGSFLPLCKDSASFPLAARPMFVAAGKRKDRHVWDAEEADNRVLPGQLKIFDLIDAECKLRLGPGGHTEEVLFVRPVVGVKKSESLLISCGQDGRLCRWQLTETWGRLLAVRSVLLGDMVFHCDLLHIDQQAFLIVAVDNGLKIVELETLQVFAHFTTGFSSYCDWVQVLPVDGDGPSNRVCLVLRGVELLNTETFQPSAPNSIVLAELTWSIRGESQVSFAFKVLDRLSDERYQANSWLLKPALNPGRQYLAAPTITGHVLVFNLQTRKCTATLHDHADSEVRQVLFHPTLPIMASCGDDGRARIYFQ